MIFQYIVSKREEALLMDSEMMATSALDSGCGKHPGTKSISAYPLSPSLQERDCPYLIDYSSE